MLLFEMLTRCVPISNHFKIMAEEYEIPDNIAIPTMPHGCQQGQEEEEEEEEEAAEAEHTQLIEYAFLQQQQPVQGSCISSSGVKCQPKPLTKLSTKENPWSVTTLQNNCSSPVNCYSSTYATRSKSRTFTC